jgi:hypothetical protein
MAHVPDSPATAIPALSSPDLRRPLMEKAAQPRSLLDIVYTASYTGLGKLDHDFR